MTDTELLKMALDALENSRDAVWSEYHDYWGLNLPTRKAQTDALRETAEKHDAAIAEIRKRLNGAS